MSDNKEIDFDTLPTSSDEVLGDDIDKLGDEMDDDTSFDDEGGNESLGDVDEIGPGDEDDEEEDDEDDENEDDEEDDEESSSKSKLKDIAIYGGGGVAFIGAGAFYLQSVLGFSMFGGSEDQSATQKDQQRSELAKSVDELRGIPSSELIKERDASKFDVSEGWEGSSNSDEFVYEEPSSQKNNESDGSGGAASINNNDDLSTSPDEKDAQVRNFADEDLLVEKIRGEVQSVVDGAVGGLLTIDHFDKSISDLERSVSKSFDESISSTESRVKSYIESAKEEVSSGASNNGSDNNSDKIVVDLTGRERLPGINVIDTSSNGTMSVVKNSSGGTNVFSNGEELVVSGKKYKVTGIQDGGNVILVGDRFFIDSTRAPVAISQDNNRRPERKASSESNRKTIERFKAEKKVADSLRRDYKVHRMSFSDLRKSSGGKGRGVRSRDYLNNDEHGKDYVMSYQSPLGASQERMKIYEEIPRQSSMLVAKGWEGSMIMGDVFLVIDPSGNWRKLSKGDRVPELGNNLVHGMDSKNNLIVGNHVIIFK